MLKNNEGVFWLLFAVGLVAYALWMGPRSTPPPPEQPASSAKAEKIKLYFFTTQGCVPCRQMKQALRDPKVVKALQRFDLEETTSLELRKKYGVHAFPTLVALETVGILTIEPHFHMHVGAVTPGELVTWLESIQ